MFVHPNGKPTFMKSVGGHHSDGDSCPPTTLEGFLIKIHSQFKQLDLFGPVRRILGWMVNQLHPKSQIPGIDGGGFCRIPRFVLASLRSMSSPACVKAFVEKHQAHHATLGALVPWINTV